MGRITLDGEISEYDIPTLNARPHAIAAGKNNDLWFTEWGANKIGRISVMDGKMNEYDIPTSSAEPHGITCDENGEVWFALECNKIGCIRKNS